MDLQTLIVLILVALSAFALLRRQARTLGLVIGKTPAPEASAAAKPSGCQGCPSGGSCKKLSC